MALEKLSLRILYAEIVTLQERVAELEEKAKPRTGKSINKVETFNGETEPVRTESNFMMKDEHKLQSARNAMAILPPNLMVDGQHTAENIKSLCGFAITEEMMDQLYPEK